MISATPGNRAAFGFLARGDYAGPRRHHTVSEGNKDYVYICTYEAGVPDSGRIRKYGGGGYRRPVELQADKNTDWTGFQRIRSLWFKEL